MSYIGDMINSKRRIYCHFKNELKIMLGAASCHITNVLDLERDGCCEEGLHMLMLMRTLMLVLVLLLQGEEGKKAFAQRNTRIHTSHFQRRARKPSESLQYKELLIKVWGSRLNYRKLQ